MAQPGPFRILGITGSLRAASFNTALLRTAIELAPPELRIERYDLRALPFFDADLEAQGDPQTVKDWKAAVYAADGLLISSPEYNHSIPAVLKNAIDWASRSPKGVVNAVLAGKPIAIIGTGGVAGTARAQLHLRQVLAETRSYVMVQPTVIVPLARTKFDATGKLTDDTARQQLQAFLTAYVDWVRFINAGVKKPVPV